MQPVTLIVTNETYSVSKLDIKSSWHITKGPEFLSFGESFTFGFGVIASLLLNNIFVAAGYFTQMPL